MRAEAGGRRAMMAPERLRELRRLAIAYAVGHLSHRHRAFPQELECPRHPHLREVGAEGRAADLGKRPLELAPRGGYLRRDGVQIDLATVVALDDRHRFAVQRLAPFQGCRTVRHTCNNAAGAKTLDPTCQLAVSCLVKVGFHSFS